MSKRVITINRMLGSNGRLIGRALADELGFAFYDRELIDIAAKKENIPHDLLEKVDEKRGSQWRFPIDHELQLDSEFHFVPMNDVLFDLQRKIILEAAQICEVMPKKYFKCRKQKNLYKNCLMIIMKKITFMVLCCLCFILKI